MRGAAGRFRSSAGARAARSNSKHRADRFSGICVVVEINVSTSAIMFFKASTVARSAML
jgi:hypothetical protein